MKKEFLISLLLFFAWTLSLPQHHAVTQDTSTLTPAELGKLHLQRIEEKLSVYTDDDVKFMQDMIIHHSQALVMSQFAPLNAASDEVQVLAARIINAQIDEIKIMQRWLLDRGHAAPAVEYNGIESTITMIQPSKPDDGTHMSDPAMDKDVAIMSHEGMDHGGMSREGMDHKSMDHRSHVDHSDMVGMLSLEQLAELRDAHGQLFDKLYLEYMIQHHDGAVVMVKELFSYDGAALGVKTYKLASDIQMSQRTEIARMQQMLNERIVASVDN